MIELKIEKMYDDVIMPEYMQLGDAGFDIHCYLHDESGEPVKSIKIWPGSSVKINTGLKTSFPHGYSSSESARVRWSAWIHADGLRHRR